MNKGKIFEEKSFKLIKKSFGDRPVFPERSITTHYGGKRKIDISVGNTGSFDFIIFECKDKKHIGIDAIDQVFSQGSAVKASKIAVIGNGKFTRDAIKYAKSINCSLFNVINPEDEAIRPKVFVKILTHFRWIQKISFGFVLGNKGIPIVNDPSSTFLSQDGNLLELVKSLWNAEKLNKLPGLHTYVHNSFNMIHANKVIVPCDKIDIYYEVREKSFLSKVEISRGEGLYDVHKHTFNILSPNIFVGPLTIDSISSPEDEVDNNKIFDDLAFEGIAYQHY